MLKNKNIFINILLCIWQITQIIVGVVCLIIFMNCEKYTNEFNGISVLKICHSGVFGSACFSTGPFIIVTKTAQDEVLKHETGHSKQSIYFGPLYHFVISIPSIIRFWINKKIKKSSAWYHSGYPERWADNLGGVDREKLLG